MKAIGYFLSLVVLGAACGQVQEKEVKLEMLPPGETNASYTSTNDDDEEEIEEDDTEDDTVTREQLAAINYEAWSRRSESCSNSSPRYCSLTANVAVTDAIVTAVRNCSPSSSICKLNGVDSTSASTGPMFAFVQKLDGTATLLHVRGSNGGISTNLNIGDKISFTATKFYQNFGTMRVHEVDAASVTIGTATATELFQLNGVVADIDAVDYAAAINSDELYRLRSGYVKVSGIETMSSDSSRYYYVLNTKSYTSGNRLFFRANSNVLTADKCYQLKNVSLTQSTTPSVNGVYVIDQGSYDTKLNGVTTYTEVDCTTAGL
ncbi:hypothetical protein [Oligoflexus tunisiensis]|uniref:hypothetical protein n=1 Tax=Oligoflexus tunisiensis TaxID=708132 RepID=UPI000A87F79F|nr:hypothetical protein [Oligoflexus tunisiensis]